MREWTAAAEFDDSNAITLDGGRADQAALDLGRADLELTGTATPVADGTAEVAVELAVLDTPEIFDPTVTFDLSPGITVPAPPEGCEQADSQLVCTLAMFYETTHPVGQPPVPPLHLTLVADQP